MSNLVLVVVGIIVLIFTTSVFCRSTYYKNLFNKKSLQALSINGWIGTVQEEFSVEKSREVITLINSSTSLIFNVVAVPVFDKTNSRRPIDKESELYCAKIKVLPPGRFAVNIKVLTKDENSLEISFQDVFGKYWIRRSNGSLEELLSDSVSYYGLDKPLNTTAYQSIS